LPWVYELKVICANAPTASLGLAQVSEKGQTKNKELENTLYHDSELKLFVFFSIVFSVFLMHQEALGEKEQSI